MKRLTDERLHEIIAESLKGRQNADKRAIRTDARAALAGSEKIREWVAERVGSFDVRLPPDVVEAIDHYISTDWKDGRDPSKLGALNAVAHIGERVVAVVCAERARREERKKKP